MDTSAKQQAVERIKQANTLLVTVSNDPSVDQLAACIGLTLLFNKMNKHATAVFSGKVPSTIEFLQPEKTIETNTDSLRDFIIALDKSKADKLRYKVEDQVVKIFITPYRTMISEKDLVFSQGDFNVEAVIALGVMQRSQLDQAITAHGRILHDATVISVNAGSGKAPNLGQINWQEPTSSSLSEMLVSITEAFGPNLIDGQIATAFLTGIVAETQRFSNERTSPKVMTMSAQLMAAGANQKLIVEQLEPPPPPPPPPPPLAPPESQKPTAKPAKPKAETPPPVKEPPKKDDGTLDVEHGTTPQPPKEVDINPNEINIDQEGNLKTREDVLPVPPVPDINSTGTPEPAGDGEKPTMPGSHSLLSPKGPVMNAPFSATTVAQTASEDEQPFNPLDEKANSPEEVTPTHAQTVEPPPVDKARNAVESALSSAPYDPSTDPVQSLNTQPLEQESSPAPAAPSNDAMMPPAPPPVPPPFMPTPGVVIPNPPGDNTL